MKGVMRNNDGCKIDGVNFAGVQCEMKEGVNEGGDEKQ
jgi:hypothetical protein